MVLETAKVSESQKSAFAILDIPFFGTLKGSLTQSLGSHSRRFTLSGQLFDDRKAKKLKLEEYFRIAPLILKIPGVGDVNVLIESLSLAEVGGETKSYNYDLRLVEVS